MLEEPMSHGWIALRKVRDGEIYETRARGRQPVPTLRSAGTRALVCRRHVRPAISPTPHPRVRTVPLFRSIPSSSLIDQKFLRFVFLRELRGWLGAFDPRGNNGK